MSATYYQARQDVLCSQLPDDEAVLLDLDAGIYYGFNAVGLFAWHLLERPQRLEDLVLATLEKFEITAETCEADLRELVEQLLEKKLVTIVQP